MVGVVVAPARRWWWDWSNEQVVAGSEPRLVPSPIVGESVERWRVFVASRLIAHAGPVGAHDQLQRLAVAQGRFGPLDLLEGGDLVEVTANKMAA